MHYYEVAPNQIIRAGSNVFTYASDTTLSIGALVEIPIGKKLLVGIVVREVKKPSFVTKPVSKIIEDTPLPKPLVSTALWISNYYATPLALVLQALLPRGLQKKRRERTQSLRSSIRERTQILLNKDQSRAVEYFEAMPPGTALLHGVTGSGKTRVYIELAQKAYKRGQSIILLVPEIALTSQLVDEFSSHFSNVILTHSKQTEAERHNLWSTVLHSTRPQIIIGPRSALFLPAKNLGFIIIDEFHEPSFKQEQSPRYSALRVASILGNSHGAKVIFGSATPPVADYYALKQSNRPIITLPTQAQKDTVKPDIQLVDMTKRANFKKHRFLSETLVQAMENTLSENKQVLIFHNRRGSASTTLCENCGWTAICPHCFIPFTLHTDTHTLRCHICDTTEKIPTHCPFCQSVDIIYKGIGTKLIESELKKKFPNKKIVRFDADSDSDKTVEKMYKELYDGTIDIIIGTQVIAKGLDLPHLRTVGVIQADAGLVLPDYSTSERTFQLLAQVVGRVGRSHHSTQVVVQSYQPNHPAVRDGLTQNYNDFYKNMLRIRRDGRFPPFAYLLKLTCIYKTEAAAIRNATEFAKKLRQNPSTQILGPTPAFYERQGDSFRWQLTIKSARRSDLVAIIPTLPATHWQFELDPPSLL
ncbi:MAG TPA: primosomal protein N' [Candidatus Saccharimonadales bacterium]|nr:primosomal protein N' [Candidatus Saccharimonadales bacterium]